MIISVIVGTVVAAILTSMCIHGARLVIAMIKKDDETVMRLTMTLEEAEFRACRDFGLTKEQFDSYWEAAKEWKGYDAVPYDAYWLANEEFIDLNFK